MERQPAPSSPDQPTFTHEKLWVGIRRLLREKTELRALSLPTAEKQNKGIKREHEELFDADLEDMCSVLENIYDKSVADLILQKEITIHEQPRLEAAWDSLRFSEPAFRAALEAYPKVWIHIFETIAIRPHLTIPGHGREYQHAVEVVYQPKKNSLSLDVARFSSASQMNQTLGYDLPLLLSYATSHDREQLLPKEDRIRHRFLKTAVLLDQAWNTPGQTRFNPTQLWKQGDQYEAELIALAMSVSAPTTGAWEEAFLQELETVHGYSPERSRFHRAILDELWKSHSDIPISKTTLQTQKARKELLEDRRTQRNEAFFKELPGPGWELLFRHLESVSGHLEAIQSSDMLRERQLHPIFLRLCLAWLQEMGEEGSGDEGRVQHALQEWKRHWKSLTQEEQKQEFNAVTRFIRLASVASVH